MIGKGCGMQGRARHPKPKPGWLLGDQTKELCRPGQVHQHADPATAVAGLNREAHGFPADKDAPNAPPWTMRYVSPRRPESQIIFMEDVQFGRPGDATILKPTLRPQDVVIECLRIVA